jgi:uncharacterized SAM-binding protein YcdF (DUF218 family)
MKRLLAALVVLLLVCGLVFFFFLGGRYLVVNNFQKSDAIVVLAGDSADSRYFRGMELLRAGHGKHLLLDATTAVTYGHSYADLAADMVARTAGPYAAQVSVCPINGDSTKQEAIEVGACLKALRTPVQSAIVATDDYHTRRALSIFRDRLPQYRWTAAAARNRYLYGQPWWKDREWAKTYLLEWQKLIWWELIDRWRK